MRGILATRTVIVGTTLLSSVLHSVRICAQDLSKLDVPELAPPVQARAEITPALSAEADDAIGIRRLKGEPAFERLDGQKLTCVVVDTGLNTKHQDFVGNRILTQVNLTTDNQGNRKDATDGHGHGTHVSGIIAADGIHQGIAPAANIIPIKILTNPGSGQQLETVHDRLLAALEWVKLNQKTFNITVVNISIADGVLQETDEFKKDDIRRKIRDAIIDLRGQRLPVVVSAGNQYGRQNPSTRPKPPRHGMEFPAIIRETISVGAVYQGDANTERLHASYDVKAYNVVRSQVAPFSARLYLSKKSGAQCRTDLFAPGGDVYPSSGLGTDDSSNYAEGGTSQAAPLVTGAILLLQQFWFEQMGRFPSVDELETWLRNGGAEILDGDDEHDNVRHTCGQYRVLDIYNSLRLASEAIQTANSQ